MSGLSDSIWDDDTWDVDCPPSVPVELWEIVPEEYRREFIIEAAFALRRGIHPIDTFEEMLEEKGIKFQTPADKVIPDFEIDEPIRPTGRMNFNASKKSTDKITASPVNQSLMQNQNLVDRNNSAAAKLWPAMPNNNRGLSRPVVPSVLNKSDFIQRQRINSNNFDSPSLKGLDSNKEQQIIVDGIGDTF